MTQRLISILLILTISCNKKANEWRTLDFGSFKLKTPKDWTKFKEQGIDAYVGGLTNGKDSLWFYYGWYISGFKDEDADKYLFAQDTVNGKIAAIKIPKKNGKGAIEMFIDNVTDKDKFQLSGYDVSNIDLIFDIFKSVTFPSSDTTKNGTMTFAKFREYPFGSGMTLYYANCTACHHPYKDLTGPALTSKLLNSRASTWLYTFFKERNHLQVDSAYLARKKEFNDFNCIELPNYSKNDIEQLVSYLKGQ